MHRFVSLLTACLLFLHMAIGCCSHHAHMCETHRLDARSPAKRTCACGAHSGDVVAANRISANADRGDRKDCDHSSPGHRSCLEPDCVTILTEVVETPQTSFAYPLATQVDDRLSTQANDERRVNLILCRDASPPLRTHLLFQVQLI